MARTLESYIGKFFDALFSPQEEDSKLLYEGLHTIHRIADKREILCEISRLSSLVVGGRTPKTFERLLEAAKHRAAELHISEAEIQGANRHGTVEAGRARIL